MTREEAITRFKILLGDIRANRASADVLLMKKVYDDFESRTCENCKYGEDTDDGGYDIYCTKLSDYMYDIQLCKKWESK